MSAKSGDIGEIGGSYRDVAGGSSEDFDKFTRPDSCSDRTHVGIESSDRDRESFGESETLSPFGREFSGLVGGGMGFLEKAGTEFGQRRLKGGEKFFVGESIPLRVEECLVTSCANGARKGSRIFSSC